jgi:MFS family permease
VPYLVFGLVAGALIDRWDRRRVLIACDVAQALAVGSVPLAWALGTLTVAQLYAVALVQGSAWVFKNLGQVAALPRVVERAQIPSAQALNASSMSVAFLAGPGIGGVLVGLGRTTAAGAALAYLADALSYVVSAMLLLWVRTPLQGERGPRRELHREIGEGLRYVWDDRAIRLLAFNTSKVSPNPSNRL